MRRKGRTIQPLGEEDGHEQADIGDTEAAAEEILAVQLPVEICEPRLDHPFGGLAGGHMLGMACRVRMRRFGPEQQLP